VTLVDIDYAEWAKKQALLADRARDSARPDAAVNPTVANTSEALTLQRLAGNRATSQILGSGASGSAPVVQREPDTSSSPSLPTYDEGETPAWAQESGVPEWAKEDYQQESKRIVMASMTSDGKIGSIYFDEGRIRTTHLAGPEKSNHSGPTKILRFNVDEPEAIKAYRAANKLDSKKRIDGRLYIRWLVAVLKDKTVDSVPTWATPVVDTKSAIDTEGEAAPDNVRLLEIFKHVSGEVQGWHPSRGAAVQFPTDKQTLSVLQAGLDDLDKRGVKDPKARNRAFYDFVVARLPNFKQYIRDPSEVE
jgi:hypothetical protein